MKKHITLRIAISSLSVLFLGCLYVYAAEIDDRIESSAKNSYVFKTYLKDDQIKTESKNGVVTLTGTVSEMSHINLAEETVSHLPGVQRVDNRLNVATDQSNNSDTLISINVKAALLFHRSVSATRTKVEVNNGIVTLRGEAYSQAEKDLATEYSKDIDGVKSVNNQMEIVDPSRRPQETLREKIDDASIAAQVVVALMSHRSTSMRHTQVSVDNGVVTLKGNAKNMAEKELVTKLVNDIDGVKSVNNNMEIAQ